ncbi:formylmethanofuran dehydrogenase subunit E family protein [Desulfosarcina sp. OttesenSCG-928-A07]|nr:formylmethanofuran dehydrogenase subunit E family protein [Desulfosarcina sp. OttesenSCG-928-G17]MDL2328914.1 formylmethanofuran dehydrogenase subunit E family protein [Desulfosarcina sp. OttesenSCG-928-A07]
MESFETLLEGSAKAHGHLCAGQVIGVRMAMRGCELIGLDNPSDISQIKKLIVYVEIDRCATDAIGYVTGAKLGRRSLKFVDNGIMAATFVNLETGTAWRLVSTESSRDKAAEFAPGITDVSEQQLVGYKIMPDDLLFDIMPVRVDVPIHDMPGPSRFKAQCDSCGIIVRDKREVLVGSRILCRACACGAYYRPLDSGSGCRHTP